MSQLDRTRLAKLMRMAESENDGEALTALRMATKMIVAAKMNWAEVIAGTPRPSPVFEGASTFRYPHGSGFRTPEQARDDLSEQIKVRRARRAGADFVKRKEAERKAEENTIVRNSNIPGMLSTLRNRKHSMSFIVFLASVTEYYRMNGYLTGKQYAALKTAMEQSQ